MESIAATCRTTYSDSIPAAISLSATGNVVDLEAYRRRAEMFGNPAPAPYVRKSRPARKDAPVEAALPARTRGLKVMDWVHLGLDLIASGCIVMTALTALSMMLG